MWFLQAVAGRGGKSHRKLSSEVSSAKYIAWHSMLRVTLKYMSRGRNARGTKWMTIKSKDDRKAESFEYF
jgi:hypothetical protein